jgi:predicted TIM-barrel fold metal-dependent hydrolase
VSIFEEPKIDCHAHILDPDRFPYRADTAYAPAGQEIGTAAQLASVLRAYGTRHVLLVQPNSGYGVDNSCMLDAIRSHPGVFKGVAIAPMDSDLASLRDLKDQGIVGIALNQTVYDRDYYRDAPRLFEKLSSLGMFAQLQVEKDQLELFRPWIEAIPVQVLIDHCGRPTPAEGVGQKGFQTLLSLAATGRVSVKLSGYVKFSAEPFPFSDTWPFIRALVGAFGLDHCMWASDWPYLKAPYRQDYGPLLELVEMLFPDAADRRRLLWETPRRLFGFDA